MKRYKYITFQHLVPLLILAAMCFAPRSGSAQQEASEIVMTAEQLESLLTRIAEKRMQRNRELQSLPIVPKQVAGAQTTVYPQITIDPQTMVDPGITVDPNLYQELRILNAKLDLLLAQSVQIQPGTTVQVHTPPPLASDLQPGVPGQEPAERQALTESNSNTEVPTGDPKRVVTAEPVNAERSREALAGLTVYFEHDQANLSAQEVKQLEDLAPQIQAHSQDVLVIIRGFASDVGNAFYNNQLSFKRADAVKAILIRNGVDPKNMMTLFHGEDPTQDAAQARRVEVSVEALQP